jgi:hypothetical protein
LQLLVCKYLYISLDILPFKTSSSHFYQPIHNGNKNAHKHHGDSVIFMPIITATAVEIHAIAFANSIY